MEKELMLQCFIIWLKIKKNITQILFLEHLIWFNYLDHSPCVPGSIIDVYLAFRVSPPLRVLGLSFSVLGLGPMYNKRPGSRVSGSTFKFSCLRSRVSPMGCHIQNFQLLYSFLVGNFSKSEFRELRASVHNLWKEFVSALISDPKIQKIYYMYQKDLKSYNQREPCLYQW